MANGCIIRGEVRGVGGSMGVETLPPPPSTPVHSVLRIPKKKNVKGKFIELRNLQEFINGKLPKRYWIRTMKDVSNIV